MDGRNFFNRVHEHHELEWLGVKEGKTTSEDKVLIRFKKTDAKFAVSVAAIRDHSWDELHDVLVGKRSPRVMTHVTRIVGYYSQLQNWNRSKLAELRDRHRGDYSIPEKKFAPVAAAIPVSADRITSAVA
jgi:hypothetical protein